MSAPRNYVLLIGVWKLADTWEFWALAGMLLRRSFEKEPYKCSE